MYRKEYYETHKEAFKEYSKKYYEEHREEYKKYYKKYYKENKDKVYEKQREWQLNNRDKWVSSCQASRRRRVERLRSEGVLNPWAVVNYGKEPRYE